MEKENGITRDNSNNNTLRYVIIFYWIAGGCGRYRAGPLTADSSAYRKRSELVGCIIHLWNLYYYYIDGTRLYITYR